MFEAPIRERWITGDKSYGQISDDICRPIENPPTKAWWGGFTLSFIFFCALVFGLTYSVAFGLGTWGINKTVGWAWDITNFVFWIGIGHAGTLISAILLLFRQKWRMSINRSAEAMTIFAVMCAGMFPIFHMGRVWNGFWCLPLPNNFGSIWVNFSSPLLWDVFAISTYFTVSLFFWYMGLIPDIATVRDRAKTKMTKFFYNLMSMGWNGSMRTWMRYEIVCLILAGISTPLVLSVHTIVSFDFATSIVPGWHTTIFPPYFVAGAIFSGFGMVLTLLVIARKVMKYEDYITINHLDAMCKVVMLTGTIVGCAYITEFFIAWYSGVEYEQYAFINRATGPYWWAYWTMMSCNLLAPQVFWFKKLRRHPNFIFFMSIIVNIGMWFERFVIIVPTLCRTYLPSTWNTYSPSFIDVGIFVGTIGMFFTLFLLYSRTFPVIAQAELKSILKASGEAQKKAAAEHSHH